jgi:hypothetical protein
MPFIDTQSAINAVRQLNHQHKKTLINTQLHQQADGYTEDRQQQKTNIDMVQQ